MIMITNNSKLMISALDSKVSINYLISLLQAYIDLDLNGPDRYFL